ncbi:DMP19 family protein [Pseudomonas phoenicis]|uniref:DMP19 family protein n=1 Tax=unclassified Pseudomonas TaxID=196821 RepID=UPI0039A24298
MSDKQPCRLCATPIAISTFVKNDGLCMPCKGGYRENIEAGKRRAEAHRQYLASPQALYWNALVNRVYHTTAGFTGLRLIEQRYYAVCVLQGEVHNGGFDQYFGNSSGDHYAQACAGLLELGATQTLALLEEAKRVLFGAEPVPSEQDARQLNMPSYADERNLECESALDALDTQFYQDTEQLHERLLRYADEHQLFVMAVD